MNSIKLAMAELLAFGLILCACSEGRNDPLGIVDSDLAGGRLIKGGNGANTVVTPANSDSAFQEINVELFSAFNKAANTLSGSQPDGPVRIMGDHTGYAVIEGSVDFIVTNFTKEERIVCDFEATFYDYSDTGKTFIGGVIDFGGYSILKNNRVIPLPILENEIKFAGSFSGSVKYSFFRILADLNDGHLLNIFEEGGALRNLDRLGHRQGYFDFTSGGETFRVQPYPKFY
jgi:hypothetical protein